MLGGPSAKKLAPDHEGTDEVARFTVCGVQQAQE